MNGLRAALEPALLATGYYEWHTVGKEKQPFYFTRADGQLMTMAGLQEAWTNPEINRIPEQGHPVPSRD